MGLHVGSHQFNSTDYQRLDGIGYVVRLVQHVSRIKIGNAGEFCINQFVENEEELKWLDRPRVEVVITVFAVVEMEAREFGELNQAGDDHLDIYIRRVVP